MSSLIFSPSAVERWAPSCRSPGERHPLRLKITYVSIGTLLSVCAGDALALWTKCHASGRKPGTVPAVRLGTVSLHPPVAARLARLREAEVDLRRRRIGP